MPGLKSVMVYFRVLNFHNLIERLENLSNFISKCSNLFEVYLDLYYAISVTVSLDVEFLDAFDFILCKLY